MIVDIKRPFDVIYLQLLYEAFASHNCNSINNITVTSTDFRGVASNTITF